MGVCLSLFNLGILNFKTKLSSPSYMMFRRLAPFGGTCIRTELHCESTNWLCYRPARSANQWEFATRFSNRFPVDRVFDFFSLKALLSPDAVNLKSFSAHLFVTSLNFQDTSLNFKDSPALLFVTDPLTNFLRPFLQI